MTRTTTPRRRLATGLLAALAALTLALAGCSDDGASTRDSGSSSGSGSGSTSGSPSQ